LPKNLCFNCKTKILRYAQDDKRGIGSDFFRGYNLKIHFYHGVHGVHRIRYFGFKKSGKFSSVYSVYSVASVVKSVLRFYHGFHKTSLNLDLDVFADFHC